MSFAVSNEETPRRRRLLVALGLLAAGVLVVDQLSKTAAMAALTPGEYVPWLGNLFGLRLVFNPGAAFSFASGSTWIFTVVAVVVAIVVVRVARRIGSRGWALALGALLGGNLGNLGDRLFRDPGFARGHVVDFLDYGNLFVGNIADIAIVVGAVAMALLTFRGIGVDGTRHAAPNAEAAGTADSVKSDDTDDTNEPADPADTTGDDQGTPDQHADANEPGDRDKGASARSATRSD